MENQQITHENRVSLSATVIVGASVAATWIAAGSSGAMAHSLRHVVTCLVLGVGVVAGWPQQIRIWQNWADFAGGIAVACVLAVMPWEVVNILAAVIILCTFAHYREGVDRRAILLTAKAVLIFAICHFLYSANPRFWIVGEHLGQSLGWIADKITGQPLSVGATFGGVDFLLLMGFLYGFWLHETAAPRGRRALSGGLAILVAQLVYLAVLAYSEKLTSLLPAPIYPVEDDYMRLGAAVWQNSIRAMLPWNLPLVALILQTLVAALMFHMANWPPMPVTSPQVASQKEKNRFFIFAPALAAILLAGLSMLWINKPTLSGKTIVAYQSDAVRWTTPKFDEPGETGYSLLPEFVRSLGGKFVFSRQLTTEELTKADTVLLLEPDEKLSKDALTRLDSYVDRGGAILFASDKTTMQASAEKIAEIFEFWKLPMDREAAVNRTASWEQSCVAMNHPASIGVSDSRNGFGLHSHVSFRAQGLAYPLVVGRWGWSIGGDEPPEDKRFTYKTGDRLGDVALVAETVRGKNGKIVLLGDMACLSDDRLPVSYEFVGRLLGYLAQKTPAFPLWRTLATGIIAAVLLLCVIVMRKAWQPFVAALAFAAAIVLFHVGMRNFQRILPEESENSPRRLAVIDASHLEAYNDRLWHPKPTVPQFKGEIWYDRGLGNFTRTLARNGYLPIFMREFSAEQIDRASLLISIAPGRSYSPDEMKVIQNFVRQGHTLYCMAGAEESRAANPLLEQFYLQVPHTPVSPGENAREPTPKKGLALEFPTAENDRPGTVHFFAGWEIASLAMGAEGEEANPLITRGENGRNEWFIVARNFGERNGCVVAIGDTFFAANANPDSVLNAGDDNERFWQWFLPWTCGPVKEENEQPKQSPPSKPSEEEPIRESGPDEG